MSAGQVVISADHVTPYTRVHTHVQRQHRAVFLLLLTQQHKARRGRNVDEERWRNLSPFPHLPHAP